MSASRTEEPIGMITYCAGRKSTKIGRLTEHRASHGEQDWKIWTHLEELILVGLMSESTAGNA